MWGKNLELFFFKIPNRNLIRCLTLFAELPFQTFEFNLNIRMSNSIANHFTVFLFFIWSKNMFILNSNIQPKYSRSNSETK